MKHNNSKIFTLGGEMSPILVILFWIGVTINGSLYAAGIYFCTLIYSINYTTSQLWNSFILNQLSMLLSTTLVPFVILLNYWCLQKRTITICYTIGCFMAIIFAIIALVLIMPYGDEGSVRREYFDAIKGKTENEEFPWKSISIGEGRCCGWYSPLDFGHSIKVTNHYQKDIKAMESLSECYNGTFKAQKTAEGTIRFNIGGDYEDMSSGCSEILMQFFYTGCVFIAGTMTWSILYTIITCCVHLYHIRFKVGHGGNFTLPLKILLNISAEQNMR